MYLSDMHTHSIASGHGTSCTISDMAKSASRKGLKLLGITDHGPATLAAGTASYFRSLTYSPRKRFNVELLYGIELNILDVNGKVDLEQELLEKLDYSIAGMHAQNFHPASKEENTKAFLNVMKNSMVKILGYENREINSLYLTSTTWVVILSILFSLLLSTWTIYGIYGYLMSSFSGALCLSRRYPQQLCGNFKMLPQISGSNCTVQRQSWGRAYWGFHLCGRFCPSGYVPGGTDPE
mgnify:CR=1 FL=1